MGRVRLSRQRRSIAGYLTGCALIVAGMWFGTGLAGSLITAGILCAASFLLLFDVEGVPRESPPVATQAQRYDPTL